MTVSPLSNSNACVPFFTNFKTAKLSEAEYIIFCTVTDTNTLPVFTLTALKLIVTISSEYCDCGPIPNILAAEPPLLTLESYPTIPPSIIIPANIIGDSGLAFSPSYASRIWRIIIRSFVRLSIPTLSTTSNHWPFPTSCKALIRNASAPCVTAVDNCAIEALGLLWPVLSAKL